MAERQITLKLQKIFTFALLVIAVLLFIFSLGFMTDFYELFLKGNSEMYDFYKSLQVMNNMLFNAALALIVLAILHIAFDFHKNTVSIFGLILTTITLLLNISNGIDIFRTSAYFIKKYSEIDFTSLEIYQPSILSFQLANVLITSVIVISAFVLIFSGINYLKNHRKQASNEKK